METSRVPAANVEYSVEVWNVERLRGNPRNFRTHPPEQINVLRQNIRTHGLEKPIVVTEDGTILGGHGITAWGATSEEAEANSLWIIEQAEQYLKDHGKNEPFGPKLPGYSALPETERRAKAAALAPVIRGLASTDKPQLGHYSDDPAVLEFLESAEHPRLGALGTSCPDHFLRTKVKPLVLDLPADAPVEDSVARLKELHAAYREDYQAYYDRHATPDSPALRGADPAIVLVPGVGMFSFGANKQTARVAGEFYLNAINVMRGAEAVSTYAPIEEAEKFRIEYWALEEAKLARMPKPKSHAAPVTLSLIHI